MESALETSLLDILEEKNILTFTSISAELGVHVNQGKVYLELLKTKTKAKRIYYVSGMKDDVFKVQLVHENDIEGGRCDRLITLHGSKWDRSPPVFVFSGPGLD